MKEDKFNQNMARQQAAVQSTIAAANTEKSLVILLTGDGKGKTTSGFGMLLRALGYQQKVAVVQFIKGTQPSGEELLLKQHYPDIPFYQMGTGFTWDTQNFKADQQAAIRTWAIAKQLLHDPDLDVLLLDELTYMLAFKFLDESEVLESIAGRSPQLSVIVTGRGGGSALRALADTVSEVRNIKHAYESGIKARPGIDY